MKSKAWLLVIFVIIVISQLTVLSSFFHSFQTGGVAENDSVVEISKMTYVFGWASVDIQGATPAYPITVQFSNGTQVTLNSEYKFVMRLPRTGDCFCYADTGLPETNVYINESQPIEAAILSNASSSEISFLPASGTSSDGGLSDTYWFTIQGDAIVSVNGYGVSY